MARALGRASTALRTRPPWHFELASASRTLTEQLGTLDLRGFGAAELPLAIRAAGALLQYVRDTQKAALPHIRALRVEERSEALLLDAASRRNLELDVSLSGNEDATLLAVIDSCVTSMGSRQLRRWLNRPLRRAAAAARALPRARRAARRPPLRRAARSSSPASATSNASWRAWRCARPARAISRSCAASLRQLPALRAALAALDSPLLQQLRAP